MLRLWLSRQNALSLREQRIAQLILGIVSQRLAPGERLPSVRALAKRLKIHPNTVSAVYCDLAHRGWVQRRRGSGVFVSPQRAQAGVDTVDGFVRRWVEAGTKRGYSLEALRAALAKIGACQARAFVAVDADIGLAGILAAEIGEALGISVPARGFSPGMEIDKNTCALGLPAVEDRLLRLAGPDRYRIIRLKSMQDLLAGHERPDTPVLIALVSRSESIMQWSAPLLSSLGFPPAAVLRRNPDVPGGRLVWTSAA